MKVLSRLPNWCGMLSQVEHPFRVLFNKKE